MGWVVVQFVLFGLVGMVLVLTPAGEWGLGRWLGVPLLLMAGLLLVPSLLAHGRNLTPLPEPNPQLGLIRTGLYAHIRHPMYAGLIALVLGLALIMQKPWGLIGGLVLAVFFNLKAREEERRLRLRYPEYAEYQQHTGRFLPRLKLRGGGR